MDRASPTIETLATLELRVLSGPQQGARAPLGAQACVIAAGPCGDQDTADIALRDDQTIPVRIRVTATLPAARLEVLSGRVTLGAQMIFAGQQVDWPAHSALQIGSAEIAFGMACFDAWPMVAPPALSLGADGDATDASAATTTAKSESSSGAGSARGKTDGIPLAGTNTAGKSGKSDAAGKSSRSGGDRLAPGGISSKGVRPRKPWHRRAEVWLAAMGGAVLLVCVAAMAVAHYAATPPGPRAADPVSVLRGALRDSEFTTLDLVTRANGQVVLRGRLSTEAQRDQLGQWLGGQPIMPSLEVLVDETLAREVAETFRVNGIRVSTQIAGPGRIIAQASERDNVVLARAEQSVRTDVRGLEELSVRNAVKPLPPPPAQSPVSDDPGKRIASLVPGAAGYLVTADGARYFIGAMLPTGHRITRISAGSVALERDGQATSLNF